MLRFALWYLAAFLAMLSPAGAGQLLVVDSQPPAEQRKGEIVDGGQALAIPAGGALALMDETGQTILLNGPYSGIPGGGGQGKRANLLRRLSAALIDRASADDLGVTRAMPTKIAPAKPWAIAVEHAKAGPAPVKCVSVNGPTELWRAAPRAVTALTVERKGSGERASVIWASGAATLNWPGQIALVDGATYRVEQNTPLDAFEFALRVAPASLAHGQDEVVWMTDAGCLDQALRLARVLAAEHPVAGNSAGGAPLFH